MTEAWHGISSGEVAVTAMCVLLMSKVMDRKDFKNGIDWPSVVYVGSILNLAAVIQALHVDRWLGVALKPYLLSVVGSPASLIVAIILSMCVIRLLIVSMSSAAAIFVLILPPLLIPLGMNPWIVCMVAFAGGDIWYLKYLNAFYLCADLGTERGLYGHLYARLHRVHSLLEDVRAVAVAGRRRGFLTFPASPFIRHEGGRFCG